ncbi:glycosyl hydrolase [Streptomyces sp. NPDC005576]|uniref:glycosyl hydrolase n=1 Tax=Streptomyces sp. NPDC005576 TaxID=3364726 RepID=UPI00367D57C6
MMDSSVVRHPAPPGRALRLLLSLVLVATAAVAVTAHGVRSAAAATGTALVGAASGRCLDVAGNSPTAGAAVDLWDCNGGANQAWNATTAGELRTFNNSMCLDAYNNQTAPGTTVEIWTCSGGANQKWRVNADGTITGTQSGLCLDATGAGTANGTAIELWNCTGGSNQKWSAPGGGGTPAPGCSVAPVSPGATQQAKNLLCYLYSQYGNHILSGQQESTWVNGPDYEINYVHDKTGKYPAVRGMDFLYSGEVERAKAWWNSGGIPMICYHMGAPTKPDTYEGSQMSVSINSVLTPGTAEYTSFLQRLDNAAGQLQQLQAAGVPVIWRPFHEAGGTWFWWSKEGGSQYQRLWRFAYTYLTQTKGLHNLIWLMPYNGSPDPSFYPGKAYVDIAGADTYAPNGDYAPLTSLYASVKNIVGSTMPIALHENGPIPDPDQLQSTGTRWSFFNTWADTYVTQSNSVAELQKVYGSSYVVTRDEVPNLK